MRNCEFHAHCGNKVGAQSETGLCKQCYSAMYYWEDKTIARKMKRMRNLEKYHARLEAITGVTSAAAARKKRARRAA